MDAEAIELVHAFETRQITASEMADVVRFLAPQNALLAVLMLSSVWEHTDEDDGRRSRARRFCLSALRSGLPLN